MFYFSSHYIPPQFSANRETSERWQFFGCKDLHFKTAKGLTRETLRIYIYHMYIYIYISVDTNMKMIMSKSSFCCFFSSCGGCSFLFQKSYPIFCLDTRYTPSGALLAAAMVFIPCSRLAWLIMCSVQTRTGISDAVQSIHQSNKI